MMAWLLDSLSGVVFSAGKELLLASLLPVHGVPVSQLCSPSEHNDHDAMMVC